MSALHNVQRKVIKKKGILVLVSMHTVYNSRTCLLLSASRTILRLEIYCYLCNSTGNQDINDFNPDFLVFCLTGLSNSTTKILDHSRRPQQFSQHSFSCASLVSNREDRFWAGYMQYLRVISHTNVFQNVAESVGERLCCQTFLVCDCNEVFLRQRAKNGTLMRLV